MTYGTLAVDYITYTSNGSGSTAFLSGVFNGQFPNISTTGTLSGNTLTGSTGGFSVITAVTGVFTSTVSGNTVTGSTAQFTTITGGTAGFTTVTGQTVTGTTSNFTTGVVTRFGVNTGSPITAIDLDGNYSQTVEAVGALNIDCGSGNFYAKTISSGSTFTVSNVPASRAYAFTLELTHTSGTVTWFSGVEWPGGTAPTLTTGKTHLFMFVTDDGGTRWRASSLINYTN